MSNPNATLYLYDGRTLIGSVHGDGPFGALDARGVYLGQYDKRKEAIAAVNAALPVAVCVADARRDGSA